MSKLFYWAFSIPNFFTEFYQIMAYIKFPTISQIPNQCRNPVYTSQNEIFEITAVQKDMS